jgi:hypothetical protein
MAVKASLQGLGRLALLFPAHALAGDDQLIEPGRRPQQKTNTRTPLPPPARLVQELDHEMGQAHSLANHPQAKHR